MKVLRVKSVNGDTSFQNETVVVHSIDFIPVVELDLEQLGKSNKENTWKYEGFYIKDERKFTDLSHYLNERKQKLYSIDITDEKDEIVVRFTIRKGNSKSQDNDGIIKIESYGVCIMTKKEIKVRYGYAIALRIDIKKIEEKSYIKFYASDYDNNFDSLGLLNIYCGKVCIIGTVKQKECKENIVQNITNATYSSWNGQYEWESKYLVKLRNNNSFIVQVRLFSSNASNDIKNRWKKAIEDKWNGKAKIKILQQGENLIYDIIFNVIWSDIINNAHYTIRTNVRSSQGTYGQNGTTSMVHWGENDTVDITHEFGHMLGNKDEYFTVDGIAYGINRQTDKGIMNNPAKNPNKNNFENIRLNIAKMLNIDEKFCEVIEV